MAENPPLPRNDTPGLCRNFVRHSGGRSIHFTPLHSSMNTKIFITSSITAVLLAARASACDSCGTELPLITLENRSGWHFGVSEQYTEFATLQADGHSISDPAHQYLHSSITQIYIGYDFGHALGVQFNVPIVSRSFRRVHDGVIESGTVSGISDVSLLAHWAPLRISRGDFSLTGRVVAGIEFPTGDNDSVLEEAAEGGEEGGESLPSGIHGHDIALGTGSVDGIFGTDIHAQWKRVFLEAGLQLYVRGSARHDYDLADYLGWHAGLGVVAFKNDDLNVALEARFAGDTKGEDSFRGVRATDTAHTDIFVGPKVIATWRDRVSVDAGFGFPIVQENSGIQSVPDIRFQAAVNIRF
jgi:hypothetical protein